MKPKPVRHSQLKTLWYAFLGMVLTRRGKRLILLVTLYMQLVERGIFHHETLDKLNRIFMLADSDEALELPSRISARVWDNDDMKSAVCDLRHASEGICRLPYEEAYRVSDEIISLAPSYLHYADHDTILREVINLLYYQPVTKA